MYCVHQHTTSYFFNFFKKIIITLIGGKVILNSYYCVEFYVIKYMFLRVVFFVFHICEDGGACGGVPGDNTCMRGCHVPSHI